MTSGRGRHQKRRSLHSSPSFLIAVLATLAAAGFNAVMVSLMALDVDLPGAFGSMTHFREPHHRAHDLTFGSLFVPTVLGVLTQLRRPEKNVAGMSMALVAPAALLLTLLVAWVLFGDTRVLQPPWVIVGAAALIAMSLHPAGDGFFRSFRAPRTSPAMLGSVVVAAVPLLIFAANNIAMQGDTVDDHAAAGHYGFMAAFSLTVIGVGILASMRPDGWRLTAWVAGLLPVLLGAASLAYPDASSSLELPWALAAITWGAAFVTTAEVGRDADEPATADASAPRRDPG